MMISMPRTLETKRLHLRPPTPFDAQAVFAYASDSLATRYMIWPIAEVIEDSLDFLEDVAAGWADGDDFCYAVTERATGRVCGAVSCQFDQHGAEIGYILSPSVWGQGYATEACQAMIKSVWRIEGLYRIWATCHVANHASIRVLEKLGMHREGRLARWALCPNLDDGLVPGDVFCYALIRNLD